MSKLELTSSVVRPQRLAELDLMRFVAAASVAIYHWTYRPMTTAGPSETAFGAFQSLSMFGYLGVDLFFMISGFVILWTASNRGPTSLGAYRSRNRTQLHHGAGSIRPALHRRRLLDAVR